MRSRHCPFSKFQFLYPSPGASRLPLPSGEGFQSQINVTPLIDIPLVCDAHYIHRSRYRDSKADAVCTRGELTSELQDLFKTRSDRTIFIQGARDLEFDDVVQVIDAARGGGADRIGLMTEVIH